MGFNLIDALGLGIKPREAQTKSLRESISGLQTQLRSQVSKYQAMAEDYTSLMAANEALLIIRNKVELKPPTYADFRTDPVPAAPPIELAHTGFGFTDLFENIQNAQKRQKDLDAEILNLRKVDQNLSSVEARVNVVIQDLTQGIAGEIRRFICLLDVITKIPGQAFRVPYEDLRDTLSIQEISRAQAAAVQQYVVLESLRNGWFNGKQRDPNLQDAAFIDSFMLTAPKDVARETVEALFRAMLEFSDK